MAQCEGGRCAERGDGGAIRPADVGLELGLCFIFALPPFFMSWLGTLPFLLAFSRCHIRVFMSMTDAIFLSPVQRPQLLCARFCRSRDL